MPTIEETRKKAKESQGWYEGTVICPRCGSSKLSGKGTGKRIELPDPDHEDAILETWEIVHFTCQICEHQWIDGEPSEAEKLEEAGWPGLFDH